MVSMMDIGAMYVSITHQLIARLGLRIPEVPIQVNILMIILIDDFYIILNINFL